MENKSEDINEAKSSSTGFVGILENTLRRFQTVGFIALAAPILLLFVLCIGLSLTPGLLVLLNVLDITEGQSVLIRALAIGGSLGLGYILFILTIIFVVPAVHFFLPFRVKAYRGPWFSYPAIPWFYHNALTYLVRYTVLDLLTPSPLNVLFYKMMGMKVGKGVMINSTNISDPCLITLGDYVTIGGSASLMAHYGMKGYLVIDKLEIGEKTTVGLNANVLGGVTIGKKCTIVPGTVVLPKTVVEDETKYGDA